MPSEQHSSPIHPIPKLSDKLVVESLFAFLSYVPSDFDGLLKPQSYSLKFILSLNDIS